MCVYVCVCVCMYVRHAQKIAKLFFERAKHAVPFQIKYIIQKKIYQPLGPQNTPSGETINLLDVHLCPKNTI